MLPDSAGANDNLNERAANGCECARQPPPIRLDPPCRLQRVAWRSPRCG